MQLLGSVSLRRVRRASRLTYVLRLSDTGNMEVFARYGTAEQKKKWLVPLLEGKTRSAFAMTEKGVASSDATNIRLRITRENGEIVVNGLKWWISGSGDPRCAVHLVMGQSDPENKDSYKRQSIVIVPADAPGVTIVRPMNVMGQDSAPEGCVHLPCRGSDHSSDVACSATWRSATRTSVFRKPTSSPDGDVDSRSFKVVLVSVADHDLRCTLSDVAV